MRVLIVRHAEAIDPSVAPNDQTRWLTDAGRRVASRVGTALANVGLEYTCIYTSPLVRAVQTAEILSAAHPSFGGPVEVYPALSADHGTTAQALAPLDHGGPDDLIVLVSHMPKVRVLAGHLCGLSYFPPFSAAAACLVRITREGGSFQWMMDPHTAERTRNL